MVDLSRLSSSAQVRQHRSGSGRYYRVKGCWLGASPHNSRAVHHISEMREGRLEGGDVACLSELLIIISPSANSLHLEPMIRDSSMGIYTAPWARHFASSSSLKQSFIHRHSSHSLQVSVPHRPYYLLYHPASKDQNVNPQTSQHACHRHPRDRSAALRLPCGGHARGRAHLLPWLPNRMLGRVQ